MKILSNVELEILTKEQTPRLKSLAKARVERNPKGFLQMAELDEMIKVCKYAGDEKATRWLQSLKILAKNGQIKRARTEENSWKDHQLHVATLVRKGEVAFDLFDHIMLKETGKRGTVVDYCPEDKNYLVALDPFELKWFGKKDLEKTAKRITAYENDFLRVWLTKDKINPRWVVSLEGKNRDRVVLDKTFDSFDAAVEYAENEAQKRDLEVKVAKTAKLLEE